MTSQRTAPRITTPRPKPRNRLILKRNPEKSNELPSRSLAIFDFAYSAPEFKVDKAITRPNKPFVLFGQNGQLRD